MTKPELREKLEKLEKEIKELEPQYTMVNKKSIRYANSVLYLGMVNLLGQWGLIGCGTYMWFCWDVMEPIAYTMLLGNLILGYSFYAYSNRDFELGSIFKYLQERKENQLFNKLGIDPDALDVLKQEVLKTRQELYTLP